MTRVVIIKQPNAASEEMKAYIQTLRYYRMNSKRGCMLYDNSEYIYREESPVDNAIHLQQISQDHSFWKVSEVFLHHFLFFFKASIGKESHDALKTNTF